MTNSAGSIQLPTGAFRQPQSTRATRRWGITAENRRAGLLDSLSLLDRGQAANARGKVKLGGFKATQLNSRLTRL